jgi:predicted Zn-dependent peptidase
MEILDNPIFPEEELLTLKKNTIQNIKINTEKTSILAQIAFKESLYGRFHPYGHSLTIEEVEAVTIEDINDYYLKEIRHSFLDVIVSGYLSKGEFALIQKGLANWEAISGFGNTIESTRELIGSKNIVQKRGSLQASIRLGGRSLSKSNPDYFNIVIVNKVLGGYFGSRLMKNLREDKGYTYGISSALVNLEYANHWIVGADVKNDVVQDAVKEIYKEINILANQPIPESELDTVKRYMIGTFISSSNTPFQLSDKFKNIYFSNLGYEYYEDYFLAISQANSKDLLKSANDWLSQPNIVEVISGDIN